MTTGLTLLLSRLRRASTPSRRWAESSVVREIPLNFDPAVPIKEGFPTLLELLREGEAFDSAIAPLIDMPLLGREPTRTGSYIEFLRMIQDLLHQRLTQVEKLEYTYTAIRVVSHALPEEPHLDPEFESVRARLSPHVFRCHQRVQIV